MRLWLLPCLVCDCEVRRMPVSEGVVVTLGRVVRLCYASCIALILFNLHTVHVEDFVSPRVGHVP